MQKEKGFIIDVIPLARLPLGRQQFFSYLSEKEIPTGSLVSVPLFRRSISGIVLQSRQDFERLGNFRLKKVLAVERENFLTSNQLQLAEFISDYYFSSLGVTLRHFMPKIVQERSKKSLADSAQTSNNKKVTLTAAQDKIVQKILTSKNPRKFLLQGPAAAGKTEIFLEAIWRIQKQNSQAQFLILLPELNLAAQALERYGQRFNLDEIVILNSQISKGHFFTNWEKIRTGEAKIILGTRAALFAPFKNLALVILDEEQDISFKQWDLSPRYDGRTVAQKLADIFKAKLILASATPRIEDYWQTQEDKLQLLKLPSFSQLNPQVEIIDMRKEKWTDFKGKKKPNFSFLSLRLQQEITWALKNKLQTILFINRQGMSRFSVCAQCKAVLRCPKCERALIYDKAGHYRCLHCSYQSDLFATCPSCQSNEFKNVGLGTHRVEKEVAKFFPQAQIEILDSSVTKKSGALEKIYQNFANKKIDILIGTQMLTKNWDFPNVGLVSIIDTDSLFDFPDFLTDEQAFAHIVQLIGRTGRPGAKFAGRALIQTYVPDKDTLKLAAEKNWEKFYQKTLNQRQDLNYPPFSKMVKLVCQHTEIEKVKKESRKIFEQLSAASEISAPVKIIGPIEPLIANVRGRHRQQIILKFPVNQEIPLQIESVLQKLSSDWIIDVDPIGIV